MIMTFRYSTRHHTVSSKQTVKSIPVFLLHMLTKFCPDREMLALSFICTVSPTCERPSNSALLLGVCVNIPPKFSYNLVIHLRDMAVFYQWPQGSITMFEYSQHIPKGSLCTRNLLSFFMVHKLQDKRHSNLKLATLCNWFHSSCVCTQGGSVYKIPSIAHHGSKNYWLKHN